MLVDPRPYTYEYRKPRTLNPTFQSRNLYESLYHRYPHQSNDYFPQRVAMRYDSNERPARAAQQESQPINRNLSEPKERRLNAYEMQPRQPQTQRNPERSQGYKLPAINKAPERGRAEYNLANGMEGGNQEDFPVQKRRGFERFRIYERQQKPFDIINCYPKENDNNRLRNFPKLTLEDGLLQRGSYHNFQTQKF